MGRVAERPGVARGGDGVGSSAMASPVRGGAHSRRPAPCMVGSLTEGGRTTSSHGPSGKASLDGEPRRLVADTPPVRVDPGVLASLPDRLGAAERVLDRAGGLQAGAVLAVRRTGPSAPAGRACGHSMNVYAGARRLALTAAAAVRGRPACPFTRRRDPDRRGAPPAPSGSRLSPLLPGTPRCRGALSVVGASLGTSQESPAGQVSPASRSRSDFTSVAAMRSPTARGVEQMRSGPSSSLSGRRPWLPRIGDGSRGTTAMR